MPLSLFSPPTVDRRTWCSAGLAMSVASVVCHSARGRDWAGHFQVGCWHIRASFPLSVDGAPYAAALRELERAAGATLRLPAPRAPVSVILLADAAEYERYVQTYFPGVPRRPALFLQAGGPGIILTYRSADWETDLRHEATHGLLHASLPFVPLWLDEGLAEYFEVKAPQRIREHPHWKPLQRRLRRGRVPSLTRLEGMTQLEQMDAADYRAAWSWVAWLLHESPQSRQTLRRYLADWAGGRPPLPLSRQLGPAAALEQRYRAFWKQSANQS